VIQAISTSRPFLSVPTPKKYGINRGERTGKKEEAPDEGRTRLRRPFESVGGFGFIQKSDFSTLVFLGLFAVSTPDPAPLRKSGLKLCGLNLKLRGRSWNGYDDIFIHMEEKSDFHFCNSVIERSPNMI
jgi:cold shock CspA family protein